MSVMGTISGKTVVVTGASDGIGYVCAYTLAQLGAKVVLVGRNQEKCQQAAARINLDTATKNITVEVADLSILSQVRDLANRVTDAHDHIDVLLNNVGGFFRQRSQTSEGLEYTFALNHMGYFVLTDRLLPALKAAAQGRIVNVSSRAHQNGSMNFNDLQGRTRYAGWSAYCQSKLMNIMFTYEIARRLEGTNVTANCLPPGFVASKFGHNNPGLPGLIVRLSQVLMAISPYAGAQTSLHVATTPALAEVSGQYFNKSKIAASSPESLDVAAQQRLWQISEEIASRTI